MRSRRRGDGIPPAGGGGGGGQQAQRDAIRKKIELHRRVFPNHAVVGWYRVRGGRGAGSSDGDDDDLGGGGGNASAMPTEEDLRVTRTEIGRYHCRSGDGDGDAGDGEGADARWGGPLFLLMDASSSAPNDKQPPPPPPPSSSSSSGNDASGEMEMDEELPLTVYETMSSPSSTGGGGVAFVNADFELETYEPERIAVERVFRTRPPKATSASAPAAAAVAAGRHEAATTGIGAAGGGPRKAGKKSKKDAEEQGRRGAGRQQPSAGSSSSSSSSAASGVGPRFARGPTDLDERLESLGSSVRAMNLRVSVLCEYLARVEGGEAEADGALLRSIDGLVRQLPLVLASLEGGGRGSSSSSSDDADSPPGRTPLREIENEYDDAMLLAYLAAVAKTARAVHVYSEKFRNTCESWKGDPHRRPLY